MLYLRPDYLDIRNREHESVIHIIDHMYGFDASLHNQALDNIVANYPWIQTVVTEYVLSPDVKNNYPTIDLTFSLDLWKECNLVEGLQQYRLHPELNFKNFVCSFGGSLHASRQLLVAILQKFGFFNSAYCSKNFSFDTESLKGILNHYVGDMSKLYNKFFISNSSEEFFQTISRLENDQGDNRTAHGQNIYNLENKLTQSFVHIVSETLATGYYPFVTEKFLYSVVTRGLFLAYAQPGWHSHLEEQFGFKKYSKIFDYSFDSIQNPVERLVQLITMVSKFQTLTPLDWHDIYQLEQDTIEHNYDCFFSNRYLGKLQSKVA